MNTAQTIIFSILAILIVFSYFKIAYSLDQVTLKGFIYLFLLMLSTGMVFIIAITAVGELSKMKNKYPKEIEMLIKTKL